MTSEFNIAPPARLFPAIGETFVMPTWTIRDGDWILERRAVTRDANGLHDRPMLTIAAEHRGSSK